ncbi:uncharacterized protein M6B38_356785 [Iris pallida]|uniref:Uncharacterized protein n=1 Tax=Iris pallida TaxID=29817 RepID=A0AAX6GMA1_IRIPA|nr:uncharacterized protein M6B38_356785 [Iris pallida]
MEFLQGLHDRFSAIRSQILLMEPFPSVAKIHNLVRQEEKQQEINAMMTPVPEAAALSTHFNKANQWNSNGKTNQRTSQPSSSQANTLNIMVEQTTLRKYSHSVNIIVMENHVHIVITVRHMVIIGVHASNSMDIHQKCSS